MRIHLLAFISMDSTTIRVTTGFLISRLEFLLAPVEALRMPKYHIGTVPIGLRRNHPFYFCTVLA